MAQLNDSSLINDANLQLYLRLESNWNDSSPNGYTLTPSGSPVFATGKFGNGIDLEESSSQYGYRASVANLRVTGNQSWGIWYKPESTNATRRVFILSDATPTNYVGITFDGTNIVFECSGLNPGSVTSAVSAVAGTWYFVVGIYDATNGKLRIYVNGTVTEATITSGSHTAGTGGVAVGRFGDITSGGYADGLADDAFMFNRVLTTSECDVLYTGISPSSSVSPSASVSPSSSVSPSISPSPSPSVSPSSSASPSISPSASFSPSSSISPSLSPSSSVSKSASASPSAGYSQYSRGDVVALPTGTNDLETMYTEAEEATVSERDGNLVGQTGSLQYMMHQFKYFVGPESFASVEIEAKSTLAPSSSPVYLQIYNESADQWETVDTEDDAPADVNFELSARIPDLTNYRDLSDVITCRVYQLAI